ncbi:DMT family transporter [Ignatzschineria sp. RMDPL8A]|uniref:DMT family transporter n=1 Tax=Ignatzschineria sp. RMDPL8A TaxID=2999236 RepID=UPI00244675DD|nr:DMT family transporter [Ignatzschineria sp. RMDPL8A]MDG9729638.1 DMT family transporter [Ignatzschineria sp. RMDPL8A]
MNRSSTLKNVTSLHPLSGAMWMVIAGMAFAAINVMTPALSTTYPDFSSGWIAFYQYLFALILILPYIAQFGLKKVLTTRHFMTHFWRIIAAVVGIQFWIKALTLQFPIGEGVALLMTSPLFASLGAFLLLKERFTPVRALATITGFIGAIIILNPNTNNFNIAAIFPLLAAFFWALHSLMIKYLSDKDHPLTMVTYMYLLMIPINLIVAMTMNFSTTELHIEIPGTSLLFSLIALGFFTAIAQYAIAKAYAAADAIFIQPFDYLKLPLNVLLGYLIFDWGVSLQFWIGAIIMVASLLTISYFERARPLAKS